MNRRKKNEAKFRRELCKQTYITYARNKLKQKQNSLRETEKNVIAVNLVAIFRHS